MKKKFTISEDSIVELTAIADVESEKDYDHWGQYTEYSVVDVEAVEVMINNRVVSILDRMDKGQILKIENEIFNQLKEI